MCSSDLPFINWVYTLGKPGKVIGDTIQITGAVMALFSSNPIGALLTVGALLGQDYAIQQQRISDNNWGEEISDRHFGWVMDAGVWYPAVLRKRIKGEGHGDVSNEFTSVYGRPEDFYLSTDTKGKIRGHFLHQKEREFRVTDNEWSKREQAYQYMDAHDPFRQWYTMSDMEAQDMLSKYGTEDFSWKSFDQDTSTFTDWMKMNADIIRGLDMLRAGVQEEDPTTTTLSASKSFRYELNKRVWGMASFGTEGNDRDGHAVPVQGADYTMYSGWDDRGKWGSYQGLPGMDNLRDEVWPRELESLRALRRNAAFEQNIEENVYVDFAKEDRKSVA